MSDWIILRTGARSTLPLLRSLTASGIDAWSPSAMVKRRLSRRPKTVRYEAPIVLSFVFVRQKHLSAVLHCLADPVCDHPAFSLFRHLGSPAFVKDGQLAPLREVEARLQRQAEKEKMAESRGKAQPYETGAILALKRAAWTGLNATVVRSDGRETVLSIQLFGRTSEMKIDTSQLRHDDVATVASAV